MQHSDFYVYEHFRPDTGQCFYVGKGRCRRAYVMSNRSTHHKNIAKNLKSKGLRIEVIFVATCLSEQDAYTLEMERIGFWRDMGVALINQTSGGSGLKVYSPELRQKISQRQSARWVSQEAREEAAKKTRKMWQSIEFRAHMSAKLKGRKLSAEHIAKTSAALRGRKRSIELRAAMSGEGNPFWGKRHPEDVLKRIAEKKRGSRLSEETKAKMRASQAARREREAAGKPASIILPKYPKPPRVKTPETIEKMRAAAKRRGIPQSVRDAQRIAVTGRKRAPFSAETLAKMSEAAKLREARKRQEAL